MVNIVFLFILKKENKYNSKTLANELRMTVNFMEKEIEIILGMVESERSLIKLVKISSQRLEEMKNKVDFTR